MVDVLQGTQNACFAFVLPTLMSLETKLNAVPLSLAKPLHEALVAGINKRFGSLFNDTDFFSDLNAWRTVRPRPTTLAVFRA